MGKIMQMLEKWMGGGPGGEKRVQTFRWLLIAGLVGIMMMILNSFVTVREMEVPDDRASPPQGEREVFLGEKGEMSPFREYEKKYEDRIGDILQNIVGVGEVEVLVTIESTEEKVVHENRNESRQITEETDRQGGRRQITDVSHSGEIVLYEASGGESPIVLKVIRPKIRGVVVVAEGAENPTVKSLILDAVHKGLNVPLQRISVIPRKQRG